MGTIELFPEDKTCSFMGMIELSIVIPVYKAEQCLHELYARLNDVLNGLVDNYEIIMVEDCGEDGSWTIIRSLAARDERVKGVRFSRNFGQHHAITAGLDYAQGNWVVVMDCDLQDRPEEIPNLYAKAKEGFDVVLARRKNRRDHLGKRFLSCLFYRIFNYLTDMQYDPTVGNFRIMSARVVRYLRRMREGLRFLPGMVEWLGFTTCTIDVVHAARSHGESTYTLRKLINLATNTIIAYSDKPLRVSIKFGFAIAGLAFLAGVGLLVYSSLYHVPIMGWSSLIVSLYFIGGIVIANLGIIGIYLGKTFDEVKKRPLYVVHETTFGHE